MPQGESPGPFRFCVPFGAVPRVHRFEHLVHTVSEYFRAKQPPEEAHADGMLVELADVLVEPARALALRIAPPVVAAAQDRIHYVPGNRARVAAQGSRGAAGAESRAGGHAVPPDGLLKPFPGPRTVGDQPVCEAEVPRNPAGATIVVIARLSPGYGRDGATEHCQDAREESRVMA